MDDYPVADLTVESPNAELSEEAIEHFAGTEVFRGDLPGPLRMTFVLPLDLRDRVGRLLDGTDGEEPTAAGEVIPEAGVLEDDGTAAREIRGAAIAEPTAVGRDE